jgi:hypothetical protein
MPEHNAPPEEHHNQDVSVFEKQDLVRAKATVAAPVSC